MVSLKKQVISEFLASFLLGLFGLGLVVPLSVTGHIQNLFQFGALFGTIIAFVIIIFNPVSGAQFNPGVTLACVVTKRQSPKTLVPFILAQICGWGLGSGGAYVMFWNYCKEFAASGAGNPVNLFFCSTTDLLSGVGVEFLGTAMLVIAVFAITDDRMPNKPSNSFFPFVIAFFILWAVTWGAGFTGTAINMARDFGPRVVGFIYGLINGYDVSACFSDGLWLLYFFVPCIGAVCGALFYDGVIAKLLPKREVKTEA